MGSQWVAWPPCWTKLICSLSQASTEIYTEQELYNTYQIVKSSSMPLLCCFLDLTCSLKFISYSFVQNVLILLFSWPHPTLQ